MWAWWLGASLTRADLRWWKIRDHGGGLLEGMEAERYLSAVHMQVSMHRDMLVHVNTSGVPITCSRIHSMKFQNVLGERRGRDSLCGKETAGLVLLRRFGRAGT